MSVPTLPPAWSNDAPAGTGRPRDVQVAFLVLMASLVMGVVASVLLFVLPADMWVGMMTAMGGAPGIDPAIADQAFRSVGAVTGVFALIFSAVYGLFIVKMRAGRNWARIVLTVLGALSALSLLGTAALPGYYPAYFAAGPAGAAVVVLSIVDMVLMALAIVLMFRPVANTWFRRR